MAIPRQPRTLFFVADAGRARLLECERVEHGRIRVEQHEAIENHTEEHEHGRPSPRAGKSGNSYASGGHEDEHQMHRFAKRVAGWMADHLKTFETRDVPLFAAPRFLGELRKLYGPALTDRVREHPADLTHLTEAALAKHQAVLDLVAGSTS
jgi:protein required for attachment to host cells